MKLLPGQIKNRHTTLHNFRLFPPLRSKNCAEDKLSRWTGDPEVGPVLKAGDAWRDRCFLGSASILTDHALWTLPNLRDLLARYADHPIAGKRDFLDKLQEQLGGAPAATTQSAA